MAGVGVVSVGILWGVAVRADEAAVLSLGDVTMSGDSVNVVSPLPWVFLPASSGRFTVRIPVEFVDDDERLNWTGRVRIRFYEEQGEVGSESWKMVWSTQQEFGLTEKIVPLQASVSRSLEGPELFQDSPIQRWRFDLSASVHGSRTRTRETHGIVTVVTQPSRGSWDLALGLLMCHEASLVIEAYRDVFEGLRAQRVDTRRINSSLVALRSSLGRIEALSRTIPGSEPSGTSVTMSLSLMEALRRETQSVRSTIPWQSLLERSNRAIARKLESMDHDRGLMALRRVADSLVQVGWTGTHTRANFRHEIRESEKKLIVERDSYVKSVERVADSYMRLVAHQDEPIMELFFVIPRRIVSLVLIVLRSLREGRV